MKTKLEYIWLDGYTPEPNLRSKIKILDLPMDFDIEHLPVSFPQEIHFSVSILSFIFRICNIFLL